MYAIPGLISWGTCAFKKFWMAFKDEVEDGEKRDRKEGWVRERELFCSEAGW